MKPDWDKLTEMFADSPTQLVADVDCTTEGKPLCESNGVKGYPTIKYGDPSALEDYKGGRDYDSLEKFATENLKPLCSPKNFDLCDDEKKAEITKFNDMSVEDLKAAVEAEEGTLEQAEADFKTAVQELQEKYQALTKEKDDKIAAVKGSGLGLMKAVIAAKGEGGNDEL